MPYSPQRKRLWKENPKVRILEQYIVRKTDFTLETVCTATFCSIIGMKADRLASINKTFFSTCKLKPENQGGDRKSNPEIQQSVIDYIKKLYVGDNHYGRRGTSKQYFPAYDSYSSLKKEREQENRAVCSLQTFKNVIKSSFNIGFSNPHVNVCFICTEFESRLSVNKDDASFRTEFKLHRLRALRFHQELRRSKKDPSVLAIVFDMQQNQSLHKFNIGEVYYKRQMWVYNLTFVIHIQKQNRRNVSIYSWLESERGKGSNEVC